jgi:hypothetical protein
VTIRFGPAIAIPEIARIAIRIRMKRIMTQPRLYATTASMIAFDKQNTVFAMNEGAELLVHDGESEGPLWRKTLDSDIVGVGADREHVTAITAKGTVATFPSRSGADMQSAAIGGETRFAVVSSRSPTHSSSSRRMARRPRRSIRSVRSSRWRGTPRASG